MDKGYWSYLAHVHACSLESPSLEITRVARGFMDIFSTNFLSVSLDHDIDFAIDMVPDTKAISIVLYRMALTELKKLKE